MTYSQSTVSDRERQGEPGRRISSQRSTCITENEHTRGDERRERAALILCVCTGPVSAGIALSVSTQRAAGDDEVRRLVSVAADFAVIGCTLCGDCVTITALLAQWEQCTVLRSRVLTVLCERRIEPQGQQASHTRTVEPTTFHCFVLCDVAGAHTYSFES